MARHGLFSGSKTGATMMAARPFETATLLAYPVFVSQGVAAWVYMPQHASTQL